MAVVATVNVNGDNNKILLAVVVTGHCFKDSNSETAIYLLIKFIDHLSPPSNEEPQSIVG